MCILAWSIHDIGVLHMTYCIISFIPAYSLGGNTITDKGAGMLADALKVNRSLQNLWSVAEFSFVYIVDIIPRGISL